MSSIEMKADFSFIEKMNKIKLYIPVLIFITFSMISCKENNQHQSFKINSLAPVEQQVIDQVWKNLVCGEIIYIPVYPQVYTSHGLKHDLTVMLSIHNVDLHHPLYVTAIDYFNTRGELMRHYLKKAIKLQPLETSYVLIQREDNIGGAGSNCLVEWISDHNVKTPLIEAVMTSSSNQLGISITREGIITHTYSRKNKEKVALPELK